MYCLILCPAGCFILIILSAKWLNGCYRFGCDRYMDVAFLTVTVLVCGGFDMHWDKRSWNSNTSIPWTADAIDGPDREKSLSFQQPVGSLWQRAWTGCLPWRHCHLLAVQRLFVSRLNSLHHRQCHPAEHECVTNQYSTPSRTRMCYIYSQKRLNSLICRTIKTYSRPTCY